MKLTNNFLVLPNGSLDVNELLLDSGRSSSEVLKTVNTTGISRIRYAHPRLLTEFIFEGLTLIYETNEKIFSGVDAVIIVSQSYDQRIPSISTRVQSRFNLSSGTFCIDIMDGCSGYIKALSLASMLEQKGCKKVLIVAGDLNSMMTMKADIGSRILFGDGVSISILESDNSVLDTRIFNNGDQNNVNACSANENILGMNGFEVFRFTRNVVPQLINLYLDEIGKSLQTYDLVALHQASKLVVATICDSLKFKNSLCDDFSCGEIGNLGAGSIGAWLSNIKGLETMGELKMMAVGYGSGLSWGLASITVDLQRNEAVYV